MVNLSLVHEIANRHTCTCLDESRHASPMPPQVDSLVSRCIYHELKVHFRILRKTDKQDLSCKISRIIFRNDDRNVFKTVLM
jgi:hypothetical protein